MSFSSAILGRPPLTSALYIVGNRASMLDRASLIYSRMARSGWFASTKSSSRAVLNSASL
jgi:hypothetical protein